MIKRNPYLAAAMSLFVPGLGHVYAGVARRFFVAIIAVHLVIAVLGLLGFLTTFHGAVAYVLLLLALIPFGIADSFLATRRNGVEKLKWYNRWYFYGAFAALFFSILISHRLIRPALGFDFYRIKSGDVPPVASRLDIVVVDTQAFAHKTPKQGDIVLVQRPKAGVFIGRITRPPSATSFTYVVGTEGTEHVDVPLNAIVGTPTYVFYSPTSGNAGQRIY